MVGGQDRKNVVSAMRRDLSNKTALITGSARRLGRHLALSLAEAGCDIVVHHHQHTEDAATLVQEIENLGRRAWSLKADFLEAGAVERLADEAIEQAGQLDILVNNVGNYLSKPVLETTPDEWRDILEANVIAPHALIRKFVAQCPDTGGHILNIGYAGVENLRPHPTATAYQISKSGLLIMTKTYAETLAKDGIRVNMISPGHLDNSVDLPVNISAEIPIGRAGRLSDIEDALHYLLDFDGYVTGVNLDVAGGYRL
ncbi:MAG: 3-oxoacyl-[acyl-carrier protein] reductase [Planctomycetota bacterium]|jgi:3-oxoacyl-[acyl-carrier protein] reductase